MKNLLFVLVFLLNTSAKAEVIGAGGVTQATLGQAWDKERQLFKNKCIEGEAEEVGQPLSTIDFTQNLDRGALAKELGVGADAEFRNGATTIGAKADYMKKTSENGYALTMVYTGNYRFKNIQFKIPKLNEVGKEAKKTDVNFRDACGTDFVAQVVQGAKLFFSIKIEFTSKEESEAFKAAFDYSSSFASVHAYLNNSKSQFSQSSRVTIGALQLGGDIERVSQIFQGTGADPNYGLGFVQCTFGDFSKCDKVLANAIEYGTDVEKGFPSQLKSQGTNNKRADLQYITMDYKTAGIFPKFNPLLTSAVIMQRTRLENDFSEQRELFNQLDSLFRGVIKRSQRQDKALKIERAKAERNTEFIVKKGELCYKAPEDCLQEMKTYTLEAVDANVMNLNPETFAQFCQMSQSVLARPELKDSVAGIVETLKLMDPNKFVSTPGAPGINPCDAAQMVLLANDSFDFSGRNIYTLDPLMDMVHIRKLKISNNKLETLRGLEGFKNLEELDARNNYLREIDALKDAGKLTKVIVQGNSLRNVDALSNKEKLTYLDMQNNLNPLQCPKLPFLEHCLTSTSQLIVTFANQGHLDAVQFYPSISTMNDGRWMTYGGKTDVTESVSRIFDSVTQLWSPGPTLPTTRYGQSQVSLPDGRIIFTGGNLALKNIDYYDPISQTVVMAPAKLIAGRAFHNSLLLPDGRILVTGGLSGPFELWAQAIQSAEIIDPNTWNITSIPLENPRGYHTANLLPDGKVLLIGGYSHSGAIKTAEIIDPVNSVSKLVNHTLFQARGGHTATDLKNGKILIAGGFFKPKVLKDGDNSIVPSLDTIEFFDISTHQFSKGPQTLSGPRGFQTATLLTTGQVAIVGGLSEVQALRTPMEIKPWCLNTADLVEPSGAVIPVPNSLSVCRAHQAVLPLSSSSVMFVGGINESAVQSFDTLQYKEVHDNKGEF